MAMAVSGEWKRMRTLGRGASGAEVFLAADSMSGERVAVKSVGAAGAAGLRREQDVMAGLRCPHVVPCIGGRSGRDGSYQLFLEFAPGGSVADAVGRSGGRLEERAVQGYAADVATGLVYLHGMGLVHGDVKARNVVIGADGRAKLADFGCSRKAAPGGGPIGGTPAFMAPEVARGEEQGPAADVWALGCTVVEMATGRTPWNDMDDVLAVLHRIGYTDAVPEVPQWLSPEAKDFLSGCFTRRSSERRTAAQLLEHPFLASAGRDAKLEAVASKWVSPKSTLDAAFWESDADESEDELTHSTAERISALACPASSLPDWDSDEGWIDVISPLTEASDAVSIPTEETTTHPDGDLRSEEESSAEASLLDINVDNNDVAGNVGEADDDSLHEHNRHHQSLEILLCHEVTCKLFCNRNNAVDFVPLARILVLLRTAALFLLHVLHTSFSLVALRFRSLITGTKIRERRKKITARAPYFALLLCSAGEKDRSESTRQVQRQSGRRKDPGRK